METGQLMMKMYSIPTADFSKPQTLVKPNTAGARKDYEGFGHALRAVTPKNSSKAEQPETGKMQNDLPVKAAKVEKSAAKHEDVRSKDVPGLQKTLNAEPAHEKLLPVEEKKKQKPEIKAELVDPPVAMQIPPVIMQALAIVVKTPPVVTEAPVEDRTPEQVIAVDLSGPAIIGAVAKNSTKVSKELSVADLMAENDTAKELQNASPEVSVATKEFNQPVIAQSKTTNPAVTGLPVQQSRLSAREFSAIDLVIQQPFAAVQDQPEASALSEVKSADIQPVSAQVVPKADATRLISDPKTQTTGTVAATTAMAATSEVLQAVSTLLPQGEKVQVLASVPTEFRFSRSSSVELAIGAGNQVTEQSTGKNETNTSLEARVNVAGRTDEVAQNSSNGSDAGSGSKDSEGFARQNLELPKPVMQQMSNGQMPVSAFSQVGSVSEISQQVPTPVVSSEHIAGQVKEQLGSRNIKQGSEQITIQLSPDHLGDIKVSFRLEDQRLKVEIVAENRTARESLLQHADALKESLARQNISMEKFEVTGGSGGNAGQNNFAQPEWREMAKNRQNQQWLSSGGYRTPSEDLVKQAPVYFAKAEHSTLDLHF